VKRTEANPKPTTTPVDSEKITVLHVDDDRQFLSLFHTTYGDDFRIISRPSGTDILEVLSRETIDALVLDYDLPGRNGLEVLQAVRAAHPSMPVIFYTGQGSEEVARQAFKAGATDYFVKEASDFAQKEKVVNSVQKAVGKCAVDAELAEQRAMLESFIEYNPYSIIMTDRLGRPIRVNKAHTKLHGLSPGPHGRIVFNDDLAIPEAIEEAIQEEWKVKRTTYSLFTDENALKDEAARRFIRLWERGEVIASPTFWYTPPLPVEGSPIKPVCFGGTGFSIKDSRGEIINYVLMHEDITARVEAEEALKKSYETLEQKVAGRTAELAETNTRLQAEIGERARLQAELEKRNAELEDYAHMVSHDLRNNLLVMQKLMELGTLSKGDMKAINESLMESTVNLRDFVERLLSLAPPSGAGGRGSQSAAKSGCPWISAPARYFQVSPQLTRVPR
jgi:FixJ family two-component response regulator